MNFTMTYAILPYMMLIAFAIMSAFRGGDWRKADFYGHLLKALGIMLFMRDLFSLFGVI